MGFIMPTKNEIKAYKQLMQVQKCIGAFKELSENIPEEDRYSAIITILIERLDAEFIQLVPFVYSVTDEKTTP